VAHVLVVDDELSIRETFQAFLEDAGYEVDAAADFFQAQALLAERSWDVVVADIVLPQVNGLELLKRVREADEDIPVIMVTGEPDVSTAAEAVRHGAYDYVAKPVTQRTLLHVVERAAEKKRLLDEKRGLEAENRAYQADLENMVAARTAELEQRNQELATLIEVGRDISATLNLAKVLKRVTRRAAQVCDAYRCTILMLSEDGETITPGMSQFKDERVDGELWQTFQDMRYPVPVDQATEVRQVIREQRCLFIPDAATSSLPPHWIEPFGVESVLAVPLVSKEKVVGLMALDHVEAGRTFTPEQMDVAVAIGAQAAIAIENARLMEAERQQRELEQQRVTALARALEKQRELDHLKDEFIQNVSHELRTPLGIVYGYAELLDSGELGELVPDQSEPIRIITRRVRMLRELVRNLTTIMEAETREPKREPVNLAELVNTQLVDFQIAAQQADLILKAEVAANLPLLAGDVTHLRRVLDNLLSNALKFTPAGGCITVRLAQHDANLVLQVADTGAGIPPDQLARVFDRFYQVNGSMRRRYGGTGLGLALVKEVVQAHGGEVSVESVEGQGSTFRVTLPVAPL
jgi:signal transduction histidine kinase/DNA-binding response OmpR family regulator